MPNILLGCAGWTAALWALASAMGLQWIVVDPATHRLAGIFAAVFAVTAQGIAFTLGIAWARILTEATKAAVLAAPFGAQARRAMMRIDFSAMLAMGGVVVAAVLGAAADTGAVSRATHGWAGAGALALLLTAFGVQHRGFTALRALFGQAKAALEGAARDADAATTGLAG